MGGTTEVRAAEAGLVLPPSCSLTRASPREDAPGIPLAEPRVIFIASMGLLESRERRCVLGADQLIGREPGAQLRLEDESISWRHASVRWTGHVWEVQDLGSLNGTFLDGRRISPGARSLLRLGSELRFGAIAEPWRLTDATAPGTSVVDLASGERISASDDLIALPVREDPELFISRDADGTWVAEDGERVWEPAELEVLKVGSRQYRFEPGAPVYATRTSKSGRLSPRRLRLEFTVTRNEEHVEITIVDGEHRTPLRARAHGYLLLTLARQRQKDAERQLPADTQGFIDKEELVNMLKTTPVQLAVDIYRARRQFSEAGVVDAAQLVERRSTTHELRIGVADLSIRVL